MLRTLHVRERSCEAAATVDDATRSRGGRLAAAVAGVRVQIDVGGASRETEVTVSPLS